MPATDLESLRNLARLARLALGEEELARLAPELERILAAFEVLGRGGPSSGGSSEGEAEPGPLVPARPRGDVALPSTPREALLAAASRSEDGFFVVPLTVGGEA